MARRNNAILGQTLVSLVNQADGDVGDHLGRAGIHKLTVKLVTLRGFASKPADVLRSFGLFVPHWQVAGAQVIFVIVQQFLETGPAYVGELDFSFLGGDRGLAAFQDVLLAGAWW